MIKIIAELGTNWERLDTPGDACPAALFDAATAAKGMGADALKLQIGLDKLYSVDRAPKQYASLQKYKLEFPQVAALGCHCRQIGIQLWASIFDVSQVGRMAPCLDGLKIASGDIANYDMLHEVGYYAELHYLPVAFSIGAAILSEVELAYKLLAQYNVPAINAMICTSLYPALPNECNLARYASLQALDDVVDPMLRRYRFPIQVGFSDHTLSNDAALVALGMGARVFEKHFNPSGSLFSNDASVSLPAANFADYVDALSTAELALGSAELRYIERERWERDNARRGSDGKRPRDSVLL